MAKSKIVTSMPDTFPMTTTEVLTPRGAVSTARGVDPKDTQVTVTSGNSISVIKVADAVTDFITKDVLVKEATEQRDQAGAVIRAFAGAVRVKNAEEGDYLKTLRIQGTVTKRKKYLVDASDQDSFSMPKAPEDLKALKESLGEDFFLQICEPTISISIKKEVMENDQLRKDLSALLFKALGSDGIKKYFDREETWRVKSGMAQRIFSYKKEVREKLMEHVTQKADSLKNATEDL